MSCTLTATCPATRLERNQQGQDIARCGISGLAQLLVSDGQEAPCVSEYTACEIWRREKERLWAHQRASKAGSYARTDGSLGWESA
jgi:hypothetical protein